MVRAPNSARSSVPGIAVPSLLAGAEKSDVYVAAETPRDPSNVAVVRGPQSVTLGSADLSPEETERAERIFKKYDTAKCGEIDLEKFREMCGSLDLPLARHVEHSWLAGKSEAKGLTLEDFKQLYGKILSSQTPAVRQACARQKLGLAQIHGTESHMRAAFDRHAEGAAKIGSDSFGAALADLGFPDHHGDGFERFADEWFQICGKSVGDTLNFHEFVGGVNLLIHFCQLQGSGGC